MTVLAAPFVGQLPVRQPARVPVLFAIFGVPTNPTTVIFSWDMPFSVPIVTKSITTFTVATQTSVGSPSIVQPEFTSSLATTYTATTAADAVAAWSINQWMGLPVNDGAGNFATVLSNTATTLTLTPEWYPNVPVAGATFVIGGVGCFYVEVIPPHGPGPLRYRFEGTGTCAAVVEGTLDVYNSPLA